MIIIFKAFLILLLLVFGILLVIVVFSMADAKKHLVEMEIEIELEFIKREQAEQSKNSYEKQIQNSQITGKNV